MKDKKIFWLFLLLIIILIIFFGYQLLQSAKIRNSRQLEQFFANLSNQSPKLEEISPKQGASSAKLIIFAFEDFQCHYCAEAQTVEKEIIKNYGSKILFVWKDLPIINDLSKSAAYAGRCAQEQGQFWPYHDLLFRNQNKFNDKFYLETAQALNLDAGKFADCLKNPEVLKLVDNDLT